MKETKETAQNDSDEYGSYGEQDSSLQNDEDKSQKDDDDLVFERRQKSGKVYEEQKQPRKLNDSAQDSSSNQDDGSSSNQEDGISNISDEQSDEQQIEMTDLGKKQSGPTRTRKGRQTSNEIEQLESNKARIEERIRQQRIKREEEIKNGEDYIGTDYSCCIFFPINIGVHLIGLITMLQGALLVLQINNVTDDASSNGQVAGPQFYNISYACLSPFFYQFYTLMQYWIWCKGDQVALRTSMRRGNAGVFYAIIALYLWFYVYFINVEKHDWTTINMILLVILMFALPQLFVQHNFGQVLDRWTTMASGEYLSLSY